MSTRVMIAVGIVAVSSATREVLEQHPVTHMLVQLPLLAMAGALLIPPGTFANANWNRGGWTALLVAIFATAFWMLPRSIDAALTNPTIEISKFVSIPLLIVVPLSIGWGNAHPVLKGFIKAQSITMLMILAFLYTHAPIRICNSYLVNDQQSLGYGFLVVSIALVLLWSFPLFFPTALSRDKALLVVRAS